jgi:hypothetical protein
MVKSKKKCMTVMATIVVIALFAGFVPVIEVPYVAINPDEPYEVDNYKRIPLVSYLLLKPSPIDPSTPNIPPPTTEPEPGALTTQEDVYDQTLGYGFVYPDGWELYVKQDQFPDKNIKKLATFQKQEKADDGSIVSVEIEYMVKSVTGLEESINEFKQLIQSSGIPVLGEDTFTLNNIEGSDVLSGTPSWKMRQVVFFANGTAYIFKYSSQDIFYRMYEETFNGIINSFYIR